MKIRIKDNSIRLRLAQDEVTKLVKKGVVHSTCLIGNNKFTYAIQATEQQEIFAEFAEGTVTVFVPTGTLTNWDTDERVGFDKRTEKLYLLIEKDWQCLKPRAHEDESNLYQNPQA